MSDGYAARLSHYPNKGVCGLPESTDSSRVFQMKLRQLKELLSSSSSSEHQDRPQKKRIVLFTGAGISTSAGIPDFRGPQGIWTVEKNKHSNNNNNNKRQRKRKSLETVPLQADTTSRASPVTMDFAAAQPTLTHRAIARLIVDGHVTFCITQNVDGLHRRSGLSRAFHAVLHGCVFTEQCQDCRTEYFRNFEVGGST
jgi:NAD+-dependent protein deacetylase sirtuin 6